MYHEAIQLRIGPDIVAARRTARDLAQRLGFGLADQTRLATAISEITRNVLQFAGQGVCTIRDESDDDTSRIRVIVEDHGPGIADLDLAMQGGHSTGGGLGAGLPGARRLVHEFEISSQPGYTKVVMCMVRPRV